MKRISVVLLVALALSLGSYGIEPAAGARAASDELLSSVSVRNPAREIVEIHLSGTGQPEALDEWASEDVAQEARQSGTSITDASSDALGLQEFSTVTMELETAFPDSFVRAGVPGRSSSEYWVEFTEDPGNEILGQLQRLPVDVTVRFGLPASAAELADVSVAIGNRLAASSSAIRSARVVYEPFSRRLELAIEDAGSASAADLAVVGALTAGAKASRDGLMPVPVLVRGLQEGERPQLETVVQGGRQLRLTTNDSLVCTGGFTAVLDVQ